MRDRTFTPDPEQMALWPDASGNQINGLNEAGFRRPRHVYWHDPDQITFGQVQKWFYQKNADPSLDESRRERARLTAIPLPEQAAKATSRSATDWTALIREKAFAFGASDVGITRLDPNWFYEGYSAPFSHIIVLAIAMDYQNMKAAPEISAGVEVVNKYTRGMQVSKNLAGFLLEQGHAAEPEFGPLAGPMTVIPAALAAGMGELGKHGSIIHRKFGSCFRLAAVLTSLPLECDSPDDFGAADFCAACQVCSNACPPDAIMPERQIVRGVEKWYVNFDKCLPFFNETAGCGICVTVCPFSRPGVGDNLVAKLARRRGGT
ncbi:MAG: 4Fe-4S dicluster domain-containing protein [Rhodobacteraceae bacterium]|nr:4Fe-4S dicluster domain-containing protein [Paracoccaceae bacterium]